MLFRSPRKIAAALLCASVSVFAYLPGENSTVTLPNSNGVFGNPALLSAFGSSGILIGAGTDTADYSDSSSGVPFSSTTTRAGLTSFRGNGHRRSAAKTSPHKMRSAPASQSQRERVRRAFSILRNNNQRAAGRPRCPPLRNVHRLHHRDRHLIGSRCHGARQINQRDRLPFINRHRRHKAIVTELNVLDICLLHLIEQIRHFAAAILQAGAAVGQILVFQFQSC